MKLADDYAEACFDQALHQRTTDDKPEAAREKLEKELRRLHARVQELEAAQARVRLSDYKQALDFLAGLHPGITIDGPPMAVAGLIFDAVQAEQSALKEEIEKKERNLAWMRKELANFQQEKRG